MAWSWGADVQPDAAHEPVPIQWGRLIVAMIVVVIVATVR